MARSRDRRALAGRDGRQGRRRPAPDLPGDPAALQRERERARALRRSAWWKRRRAAGRCHYCGRAVGPRNLTMDHVVPLGRGGRSVRGNLVPACKTCNTEKQRRLPVEWEAYLRRLGGDEEA